MEEYGNVNVNNLHIKKRCVPDTKHHLPEEELPMKKNKKPDFYEAYHTDKPSTFVENISNVSQVSEESDASQVSEQSDVSEVPKQLTASQMSKLPDFSHLPPMSEILDQLSQMRGKLPYKLTNDYLFHAVFQTNKRVLKELLAAILHLDSSHIRELEVLNPILLGETINEKTCILDLFLLMNDNTRINIEMQVASTDYYMDRALLYACRAYDNLERGEEYQQLKPVVHISLLANTPRNGERKFYSENRLCDTRDGKIYTRNFGIIIVQLKENENAEKPEIDSGLDKWARLFLADTWEELQEMIKESEWMAETMYTLRNLTEDEKIRLECEARDRYEHDRASLYGSGVRAGIEQGRLAEQANTERERQRAEAERASAERERQRAEAAEAELAQLRALIAEKGITPGQ